MTPLWALMPETALLVAVLQDATAVITAPTVRETAATWWRDVCWVLDLWGSMEHHRFAFPVVCAHLRLEPARAQQAILARIPRAVARRFAHCCPKDVAAWRVAALAQLQSSERQVKPARRKMLA